MNIYLDDEENNQTQKDDTSNYLKAIKSQASLMTRQNGERGSLDMIMHPDKLILTSKSSMKQFDTSARTALGGVPPARDRILDFKRRQIVREDSGI